MDLIVTRASDCTLHAQARHMIGERLLEALNARGVSQAELARRLEATPQTVNRWVNNRVMPGGQSLTQIALILDVRVEYLTGKVDDMGHFGANMELDSAEWKAISALADRAIHDPLSFTATVAPARRRIHKMRQRHGIEAQSADIQALLTSQRFRCWWCGALVSDDYHVDHRVPLSRGGTSDLGNLCASCPSCNLKKHDKMPWEFCGRLV